jgi:hypothetical protein
MAAVTAGMGRSRRPFLCYLLCGSVPELSRLREVRAEKSDALKALLTAFALGS